MILDLVFARFEYDLFTIASVCTDARSALPVAQTQVRSITTSSLEVQEGSLFVPLTDRRDGHEFIRDAVKRGAAAYFLKKNHPIANELSADALRKAITVDDPLLALGRLAHFHRMRFAPFVVAVTGSNGKTTTKEMLAQIFRRAFGRGCIATKKNYNNHIGLPFTLLAIGKKTRVAIVEMGMNHTGEIAYLSQLARPHAAVISSIGHAHIEFFKSRAGIAAAKAEICAGMQPGGSLFVPEEIAELATIVRAASRAGIAVKKINPRKKTVLQIRQQSAAGFLLNTGKTQFFFPHANAAWVSNLALAAAVAADAGVPLQTIAASAQKFKPAAGRMQLRRGFFTVIDDGYNANPDSAVSSIDAALQIAAGRPVICVFGDFRELGRFGKMLHAWTGEQAARKGVAAFYGVGSDMKTAVRSFQQKVKKNGRGHFFGRGDVAALVAELRKERRGSVILVKGSRAMKMEEIVSELLRKTA